MYTFLLLEKEKGIENISHNVRDSRGHEKDMNANGKSTNCNLYDNEVKTCRVRVIFSDVPLNRLLSCDCDFIKQ